MANLVNYKKKVWVRSSDEGFILGNIVDIGSETVTVKTANGTEEIGYSSVFPAEDEERKDVDDNCALMFLNEATLLHNVHLRYSRDQIYTYVANILIAVNPYCAIRGLYSSQAIKDYQGKSLGVLPPHVFAIADKAYRDMKRLKESQSIIVSGESGAGKTESQKLVLRHLCESWGSQSGPIEQRILESNPILEAFGNAKTLRNNNSSRFGKFVEIHFGGSGEVAGGFVSHYLLEKSRICRQQRGERNYHIFYQLCGGAPEQLRHQLRLKEPAFYTYLKHGCTQFFGASTPAGSPRKESSDGLLHDPVVDDARDFARLDGALGDLGLNKEERFAVYAVVAAVLHLGNITFADDPEDTKGGCSVSEEGQGSLLMASGLLGVEKEELRMGLTSRIMQATKGGVKGTVIRVPLKIHEARSARDALAKSIYSRLFDYIVYRINKCIPFGSSKTYIGVLDIAGFEFFAVNGFEQFCINWCNEKLQHFFNDRILKQEQELYEQEGLRVKKIEYMDNQDCIDLIEEKGVGILDILDEENKLPRPSPQHFTSTVHQKHKQHFRLSIPRKSKLREHRDIREDEGFLIRHFAGAVCYQTALFTDKNNDALHFSLEMLIQESKSPLLRRLFQEQNTDSNKMKGKLGFVSVGSKFRSQLKLLMKKLGSAGTHFVRCVKPNSDMVAHQFDGAQILSQLQCSGMTSVLELMQQGFPSRTQFSELYKMYRNVMPPDLARLDPRLFCKCLFKALGLAENDFKFGVSKVFFRAGRFAEFDNMMKGDPAHLAALVRKVKVWLIRIRWKKVQWCALSVIKLRKKIEWRREALVKLQAGLRGWRARKRYRPKYKGILKVKSLQSQLTVMRDALQDLRDRNVGLAAVQSLELEIQHLALEIRDTNMSPDSIEKRYQELLHSSGVTLTDLRRQARTEKSEERKLKEVEQEMAVEKEKHREEENLRAKEEEEKQRRMAQERARREEEQVMLAEFTPPREVVEQQQKILEETERHRIQKLEQERRDRELAIRLAKETNGIVEDMSKSEPSVPKQSTGQYLYDLTKWCYAELRDVINTSNNVDLLEACRDEFRRRLQAFQEWKSKNRQTGYDASTARMEMTENIKGTSLSAPGSSRPQRFFRVPFNSELGAGGYWYAHFDGQNIGRQMEIHPNKIPLLLITGRDNKEMCQLTLEQTGLTRKAGAEIPAHFFEAEWAKNRGPVYKSPTNMPSLL